MNCTTGWAFRVSAVAVPGFTTTWTVFVPAVVEAIVSVTTPVALVLAAAATTLPKLFGVARPTFTFGTGVPLASAIVMVIVALVVPSAGTFDVTLATAVERVASGFPGGGGVGDGDGAGI